MSKPICQKEHARLRELVGFIASILETKNGDHEARAMDIEVGSTALKSLLAHAHEAQAILRSSSASSRKPRATKPKATR